MKMMKKVLSSVIAASLAISCCAISAFASEGSKAHVATLAASKTTDLKAGDTVTLTITIDNTKDLSSVGYKLIYDTTAFEIDNANVTSRVENYINKSWLDDIKDTDGDWGYYMGTPQYFPTKNDTEEDYIAFAWAGAEGVEADYAQNNRVIGSFNFKVKTDAADGSYNFAFEDDKKTCYTLDNAGNTTAKLTANTLAVKVGAEKVAPTPSKDDTNIGKQEQYTNADGTYNAGAKATVTADSTTKGVKGISFVFNNGTKDSAAYDVEFATTVTNGSASAALNITGVPADVTLTLKSATAITE